MKEPIKKLPEKLEYTLQGIEGRQTKCVPDNKTIMDKVNEIIDYIQPVPPTDTVEGEDIISKDDSMHIDTCKALGLNPEETDLSFVGGKDETQSTLDEVVEKIYSNATGLVHSGSIDNLSKIPVDKIDVYTYKAVQDFKNNIKQILSPYIQDKQEQLIPLDVDKCYREIYQKLYGTGLKLDNTRERFICDILSKYGQYPKQEEDEGITLEEAEEQIKQCTGIDKQAIRHDIDGANLILKHTFNNATPTPTVQPVTSNVEEINNILRRDLEQMMYSHITTLRSHQTLENRYIIADNHIRSWRNMGIILSPEAHIPQQKKRNREEINQWFKDYILSLGFGGHTLSHEGVVEVFAKDNGILEE